MKCKQLKKIELFHKGGLNNGEVVIVRKHLDGGCSECTNYLNELKQYDRIVVQVKSFNPELENPGTFRNEILERIQPRKKWSIAHELNKVLDSIIYILIQPATRYSFITAALLIFGVFIYQQTIIVQKIGSLEKRIETKQDAGDLINPSRKTVEAFFKKRSEMKTEDREFNELLDDYRLLQIKQKVLLKVLKEKYPETYRDIIKELEAAELLPENINI